MSDQTIKARLLLERANPTIFAIPYLANLDVELTTAELRDVFDVVEYDPETETFSLRDNSDNESYMEYTLPIDHVLVFNLPTIEVIHIDDLYVDYIPVADFTHRAVADDDNTITTLNDLVLRVAKLEEQLATKTTRTKATKATKSAE